MEHEFTKKIQEILKEKYGTLAQEVFTSSEILQYLNNILSEIVKQSKVEFSYDDDYDITQYEDPDETE